MSGLNEQFLDDVFLTLKKYVQEDNSSREVVRTSSPDELRELIPNLIEKGVTFSALLEELKLILDHSVQTTHPLFLNQLLGGFNEAAWAGEMASMVLNPTMATFEMTPVLTVLEKKVIAELIKMLGFERGEGIMVTGGSNSNLLAMLCARSEYGPNIRLTGFEHNRFRVYASAESHYSFDKAANISGIGTQNLVLVPANEKGEMVAEELEKIITADIREGLVPIMVGATAGTTVMGAFDPIKKIAKICKDHRMWLHVDAAWGGGALFTQKYRYLLSGIESADSVAFDAHKTMGTPLMTSFFLTKHAGILRDTNRGGGSEYLFHDKDHMDWDTGTYSLQCGRRADILKFWFLWRSQGSLGLSKRMDHLFKLCEFAIEKIQTISRFKLLHANYLNVCFQVSPLDEKEDINNFTLKVRQELLKEGKAMVNYAERPDGTIFLRLVFPNQQTQITHVDKLFNLILEACERADRLEQD